MLKAELIHSCLRDEINRSLADRANTAENIRRGALTIAGVEREEARIACWNTKWRCRRRGWVDVRTANRIAVAIIHHINRGEEAIGNNAVCVEAGLVKAAIIGRQFIAQIVGHLAANTANETQGFKLVPVAVCAKVSRVTRDIKAFFDAIAKEEWSHKLLKIGRDERVVSANCQQIVECVGLSLKFGCARHKFSFEENLRCRREFKGSKDVDRPTLCFRNKRIAVEIVGNAIAAKLVEQACD